MFSIRAVSCILAAISLGGCATMLRDGLREDAMAKCAEQGLRYLENNAKARERVIVSSGEIEYMCVGPDHPRYAEAIDPNL